MDANRRLSILIVDDDPEDQLLIREMLFDADQQRYRVEAVAHIDEAIEKMESGQFDAYLVDYRLGAQSGLDLFRTRAAAGDRTPFILLTGQGDLATDMEAMLSGVSDYLVKGQISPPLLERSIRYAIARVDLHAQILQQDRLASIGLLASSLAHEIGTPLGVIRGRAEYLSLKEKNNTSVQETTEIIISQIDRVSELIRSLLNLARGEKHIAPEAVELKTVVKDVHALLQYEFRKNSVEFENKVDDAVWVQASSGQLHQVLLNLCVNAIHAIENAKEQGRSQGHKIKITAQRVTKDSSNGRKTVVIEVEDSGSGISEANMVRLFTPFFTTKDIGKGTGLGLATSYRIVESWGGRIYATSQLGQGSVFTIELPEGCP